MKNIPAFLSALLLCLALLAACGSSRTDSNGVPTQMGTDADSTETPYTDTTSVIDSGTRGR